MRLYDHLLNVAREEPQKIALEFQDKKIPYGYLGAESLKLAAGLRSKGLETGQSVGAILPNIPQFVAAEFGTNLAGGTFVPMNVMLRPPEIRYVIEDSDLKFLIVYEMFLPGRQRRAGRNEEPAKGFRRRFGAGGTQAVRRAVGR